MQQLGQHFLTNRSALKTIVRALDLRPHDTVIEIGAGHGELTSVLQSACREARIIAIEKDKKLIAQLQMKFPATKNIKIIEGDILKILPDLCFKFHASRFKITGNIPFYLTGYLLRLVGDLERKPKRCVFTVQKEVAERIVAEPPRMNKLAASVQFWAEPTIVGFVSKGSFRPAPKVDSAIIKLETCNMKPAFAEATAGRHEINVSADGYCKTVNILFGQPRKTILNNLLAAYGRSRTARGGVAEKLKGIGISPGDRPQNLTVENIASIAALFPASA